MGALGPGVGTSRLLSPRSNLATPLTPVRVTGSGGRPVFVGIARVPVIRETRNTWSGRHCFPLVFCSPLDSARIVITGGIRSARANSVSTSGANRDAWSRRFRFLLLFRSQIIYVRIVVTGASRRTRTSSQASSLVFPAISLSFMTPRCLPALELLCSLDALVPAVATSSSPFLLPSLSSPPIPPPLKTLKELGPATSPSPSLLLLRSSLAPYTFVSRGLLEAFVPEASSPLASRRAFPLLGQDLGAEKSLPQSQSISIRSHFLPPFFPPINLMNPSTYSYPSPVPSSNHVQLSIPLA